MTHKLLIQFGGMIGAGKTTTLEQLKESLSNRLPQTEILYLTEHTEREYGLPMQRFYSGKMKGYAWETICLSQRLMNHCKLFDFFDRDKKPHHQLVIEDRGIADVLAFIELQILDIEEKLERGAFLEREEMELELTKLKHLFFCVLHEWIDFLQSLEKRRVSILYIFFEAPEIVIRERVLKRAKTIPTREAEAEIFKEGTKGFDINQGLRKLVMKFDPGNLANINFDPWNIGNSLRTPKYELCFFDSSKDSSLEWLVNKIESTVKSDCSCLEGVFPYFDERLFPYFIEPKERHTITF